MSLVRFSLISLVFLVVFQSSVYAGEVDEHAPIGVMAEHMHKQGEWMTSYRYMHMDMPDNYVGTDKVSVGTVLNDFMVSPIEMTMQMHMVGVMYGVTDDFTAMVMIPYIELEMDHRTRSGAEFTTKTEGLGDVRLTGLFSLKKLIELPVHLNFGVSFPSGEIDETGTTPMGPNQPLPYPMQLGSGSYAFLPGITYIEKSEEWSWGGQYAATIQLNDNDFDYKLGDRHEVTAWVSYQWAYWMSSSFRVKYSDWGNISGAYSRLNPNMVPTASSNRRGGSRLDLFAGINLLGPEGFLPDHRLALEVGHPVYQDLNGPQLGAGLQGTAGWQYAF